MSETVLRCRAPDFSKCGAGDVIVRVSIDGAPFTVNVCSFNFHADTCARKCTAFGPGLLARGNPAGRLVSFVVQAKDASNRLRTCGGDLLSLRVQRRAPNHRLAEISDTSPSETAGEVVEIVDEGDGTYRVSYSVPNGGEHTLTMLVDETPNGPGTQPKRVC